MKEVFEFLKTTVLGGLIFLLPLMIIFAVLGKAFSLVMEAVMPIMHWINVESVLGFILLNVIVVLILLLVCFFAGLIAKSFLGNQFLQYIEDKLSHFPGYNLLKARLTGKFGRDETKINLKPVLVKYSDKSEIGFLVDQTPDGQSTIFLPGSPDPWTGSIVLVSKEQITPLDASMQQTINLFENLGRGSYESQL